MKFIISANQHNEIFSDKCGVLVSQKISDEINYLIDKVKKLEDENAKLRKCVEFYAEIGHWGIGFVGDMTCIDPVDYEDNRGGKRARQILKELEE